MSFFQRYSPSSSTTIWRRETRRCGSWWSHISVTTSSPFKDKLLITSNIPSLEPDSTSTISVPIRLQLWPSEIDSLNPGTILSNSTRTRIARESITSLLNFWWVELFRMLSSTLISRVHSEMLSWIWVMISRSSMKRKLMLPLVMVVLEDSPHASSILSLP